MIGKNQNMDSMCQTLRTEIDLEHPRQLIDQECLCCTQRVAQFNPQAVESQTELFKKFTTTRESDEKIKKEQIRWKRSLLGTVMRKVMPKNVVIRTKRMYPLSNRWQDSVHRRFPDTTRKVLKQAEGPLRCVL